MILLLMMMMMMLTVEKLGSCFVKVEDDKQQHCPLYKTITSLPAVHTNCPFGVSIFTSSSSDDKDKRNRTQCSRREVVPRTKQQLQNQLEPRVQLQRHPVARAKQQLQRHPVSRAQHQLHRSDCCCCLLVVTC